MALGQAPETRAAQCRGTAHRCCGNEGFGRYTAADAQGAVGTSRQWIDPLAAPVDERKIGSRTVTQNDNIRDPRHRALRPALHGQGGDQGQKDKADSGTSQLHGTEVSADSR